MYAEGSSVALPSSTGLVTLAVDGVVVSGSVHAADPTLGLLLFELDEAVEGVAPEEGATVRISWPGESAFGAQAELIEIEDEQRWVLGVPSDLSPTQRRRAERVQADGAWRFVSLDDEVEVEIYDLSEGGLGLQFAKGFGPDRAGRRLSGHVMCDGNGSWPVTLHSTNVRRHPDDGRLWIVGCKVEHTSAANQRAYLELLDTLG